jgi:RHS repeat-associated protein
MSNYRARLVVAAFVLILASVPAFAQTNPNEAQGLTPYDSLHGGNIDNVSMTNGGLFLNIPLVSFPQRGSLDLSFFIRYSSKQWQRKPSLSPNVPPSWEPVPNTGAQVVSSLDWWMQKSSQLSPSGMSWSRSVTSPDGGSHQLGGSSTSSAPTFPLRSLDASGLLNPDNNTLVMSDGTRYSYPFMSDSGNTGGLGTYHQGVQPSTVTDTNGNQISINTAGSALGWLDTMNRIIPGSVSASSKNLVQPGVPTTDLSQCPAGTNSAMIWNVPGFNGGVRTYWFCYTNVAVTNPPSTETTDGQYNGTMSLLTTVILPDSTRWTFSYDGYGDLVALGFPTGGSITYAYKVGPSTCDSNSTQQSMWVTQRTVDANDGTSSHTWSYNYSGKSAFTPNGSGGSSLSYSGTTTMTAPPTAVSPAGDDTVYTVTSPIQDAGCSLYATQTQYYQGRQSGGILLKTTQTEYSGNVFNGNDFTDGITAINVVPTRINTTIGGRTKSIISHYDPDPNDPNNPPIVNGDGQPVIIGSLLRTDEYDFSGALQRSMVHRYVWEDSAPFKTYNFVSLVSSNTVLDSGGVKVSQTTFGYDDTSRVFSSGVTVQHVASPTGNMRGNLTYINHWLDTTDTVVTNTVNWYDTGMMYQEIDPAGRITTFTYAPDFYGAYPTKTDLPDTQMPDPGAPVVHHSAGGYYDFNTGLLTSFTDENGQSYNYQYNDPMLRMTKAQHPDGGETDFYFPNPTTVERKRKITGTTFDDYFAYSDGLGRTVKTKQLDAKGNLLTQADTKYDELGRTASVSNPYVSTTESTYGLVQYQYDALGRTTKTIKQDGSASTAVYNDNSAASTNLDCTTATDEAGKQRRMCTDFAGRLAEVDEPGDSFPGAVAKANVAVNGNLNSTLVVNAASNVPQTGATSALTSFTDSYGSHVFYIGTDQHVYSMVNGGSNPWANFDLTSMTGNTAVAAAKGGITSFVDSYGEHVFYIGTNQHVYSLITNGTSGWSNVDLTAITGNTLALANSALTSFVDSHGEHIFYVGADQHIYSMVNGSAGGWANADLNATAGSTALASPSTGLTSFPNSNEYMFYVGTNQHIFCLFWSPANTTGWASADLTAITGNTPAASNSAMTSTVSFGAVHIYYLGANQHVEDIYFTNAWNNADLNAITGSPLAGSGSGITAFADNYGEHIYYVTGNQHVENLLWSSGAGWNVYDMMGLASTTALAGAGSALTSFADAGEHIFYTDNKQQVEQLGWSSTAGWVDQSLTVVKDAGTVSLTVNTSPSVTATVCYGNSAKAACQGKAVNKSGTDVAAALTAALNTALGKTAAATASGSTITLTWGGVGNVTIPITALSSVPDNTTLFPNGSFAGAATSFSGGADPTGATLDHPYVTTYQYNARGDLLCVHQKGSDTTPDKGCADMTVPAAWRPRNFTYDSFSRLLTSVNPEAGTITYRYNDLGQVVSKTDARSITTTYSYDALNRGTGITYSNGTPGVSYRYDYSAYQGQTFENPVGRMVAAISADGAGSFTSYDSMSRVKKTVQCIPGVATCQSFTASYDLLGDDLTLNYPSGLNLTYGYDGAARLTSVADSTGFSYANSPTYLPTGSMQQFSTPNINYHVDFNNRLQPTEIWAKTKAATPAALFDKTYQYDPTPGAKQNDGDVLSITNLKDSTRTQTFTYDALNRLATAGDQAHWANSYVYDAWGNLTQKNPIAGHPAGESLSATADTHNRLTAKNASGAQVYTYDPSGNLLNDGNTAYTYDAESRIKSSTIGGVTTLYTYDAEGRRVRKATGTSGAVTNYWYGPGGAQIAESDAAGNFTNYVFFAGQRLARNVGGDIKYYITDHLHSTAVFADKSGAVIDDNDFYPWGGVVPNVGFTGSDNHFKFTGTERDAETGLDYFGARYYSSSMGRFVSADWSSVPVPVPYADPHDPQTLNLYGYARNSPVTRIDVGGHWSWDNWSSDDATNFQPGDVACAVQVEGLDDKDEVETDATNMVELEGPTNENWDPSYKPHPSWAIENWALPPAGADNSGTADNTAESASDGNSNQEDSNQGNFNGPIIIDPKTGNDQNGVCYTPEAEEKNEEQQGLGRDGYGRATTSMIINGCLVDVYKDTGEPVPDEHNQGLGSSCGIDVPEVHGHEHNPDEEPRFPPADLGKGSERPIWPLPWEKIPPP